MNPFVRVLFLGLLGQLDVSERTPDWVMLSPSRTALLDHLVKQSLPVQGALFWPIHRSLGLHQCSFWCQSRLTGDGITFFSILPIG